jgi:hypothetical protein
VEEQPYDSVRHFVRNEPSPRYWDISDDEDDVPDLEEAQQNRIMEDYLTRWGYADPQTDGDDEFFREFIVPQRDQTHWDWSLPYAAMNALAMGDDYMIHVVVRDIRAGRRRENAEEANDVLNDLGGWLRDVTQDGDVESNPGWDHMCGNPSCHLVIEPVSMRRFIIDTANGKATWRNKPTVEVQKWYKNELRWQCQQPQDSLMVYTMKPVSELKPLRNEDLYHICCNHDLHFRGCGKWLGPETQFQSEVRKWALQNHIHYWSVDMVQRTQRWRDKEIKLYDFLSKYDGRDSQDHYTGNDLFSISVSRYTGDHPYLTPLIALRRENLSVVQGKPMSKWDCVCEWCHQRGFIHGIKQVLSKPSSDWVRDLAIDGDVERNPGWVRAVFVTSLAWLCAICLLDMMLGLDKIPWVSFYGSFTNACLTFKYWNVVFWDWFECYMPLHNVFLFMNAAWAFSVTCRKLHLLVAFWRIPFDLYKFLARWRLRYKVYDIPCEIIVNYKGQVETMWVDGKKIEASAEVLTKLFNADALETSFKPEQSCSTTRFKPINGTKECVVIHNAPDQEVQFEVQEDKEKGIVGRKSMWGTASFVRDENQIFLVTAKHVLRDLRVDGLPVTLRSITCDKRGNVHVKQLAHFDLDEYPIYPGNQDYVYWQVPERYVACLEVSVLDFPKRLSMNDPIKVFSFLSDGLHVEESSGIIKGLTPTLITYDCSTRPGSSGGPILMGSNFIGIHTTAAVGEDLNLGIPMFTFGFKPNAKIVTHVEEGGNRGKNKRRKVVNFGSETTPSLSGDVRVMAFQEEQDAKEEQAREDAEAELEWLADEDGPVGVYFTPFSEKVVRQHGDKRFSVQQTKKQRTAQYVSTLNLNEDYGAEARNTYKALKYDSSNGPTADSVSAVVVDGHVDEETQDEQPHETDGEVTKDWQQFLKVVEKRLLTLNQSNVKFQLESAQKTAELVEKVLAVQENLQKEIPSAQQIAPQQMQVVGKGNKRNRKNKQKLVELNVEQAQPAEVPKDFQKPEVSGPSRSSKVSVDTNLQENRKLLQDYMKWAEQQSASLT